MNVRPLTGADRPMLEQALANNKFHPGEKPEWYMGPNMFSVVYEDEKGPVGVLRYTKTLRLCTVWVDNDDRLRNAASIMQAIEESVKLAQADGFTEIIFNTNSPQLANFCTSKLGFEESRGEYRLFVEPRNEA